jgi:mono/diheme cytochrome c family protein
LAAGCASEDPIGASAPGFDAGSRRDVISEPAPRPEAATKPACTTLQSAEPIPARLAVMSASAPATTRTVFVKDVFSLFRSTCGGCHVDGSQGGFHVDSSTFPLQVGLKDNKGQKVLDRLTTDDPLKVMPPSPLGKPASERGPNEPVSQLLILLETWMAANAPPDVFSITTEAPPDTGASPYLMTETVGNELTNIGNCVPNQPLVASEQKRSGELDTRFALLKKAPPGQGTLVERIGLPEHIEDTDLFTLDQEALAREGVVAYAPTYPLWSDNARKLRHVRVPTGESIRFHKDTQTFEIPPNTRFYKTFLKRVVDSDGSERFRKIETRLIVSRPDINHPEGPAEQTALFGTYAWNDDETSATLVTDPLRNGEPFRDRLITYITDEPKAQAARDSMPDDLVVALRKVGAIRSYAIPGSERCIQCHMGSPSQSFILGFTPLQIWRRPLGEGGVIEPSGPDELTQLQRLIDYGVITGMDSPKDVIPLESSQGDRKPRNEYELRAQGYMVGNCAHCHNPRGYPSSRNPLLVPLLNFLPSPKGGIFQFPLDSTSPRITRSVANSVPMPYITPSLADLPSRYWDGGEYRPYDIGVLGLGGRGDPPLDPSWTIAAPWRSLIYRNVDTPFPYAADLALLPHMPMNVPGYDCRAPRIMGDWMVSIPAVRKNPELGEFLMPYGWDRTKSLCTNEDADANPQPYVEVKPGDPGYEAAARRAEERLLEYHDGRFAGATNPSVYSRYSYCPDTGDIVDPSVTGSRSHQTPTDEEWIRVDGKLVIRPAGIALFETEWPKEGVPDHPHWVVTDLTENPGPWVPRRLDWPPILHVPHEYPSNFSAAQKQIVELLAGTAGAPGITLTKSLKDFALHEVPFGLWKTGKSGCDFSSVRTVSSYSGAERPKWFDKVNPPPNAPVYAELPGAAVFNMICVNCHGPEADSKGRQAETLMLMTGGETRVANLRDGLFGPATRPGQTGRNWENEFAPAPDAGTSETAEDWAARYLVWMGLGGTSKVIPPAILSVVANTQILGVGRFLSVTSANMLSSAQEMCSQLLRRRFGSDPTQLLLNSTTPEGSWADTLDHSSLLSVNGDAELWAHLCRIDNPIPIRTIQVSTRSPTDAVVLNVYFAPAKRFPTGRQVLIGNDNGGNDATLLATNLMPWCIINPESFVTDAGSLAGEHGYIDGHMTKDGHPLPICPDELFPTGLAVKNPLQDRLHEPQLDQWATRGAVNAGFSVFLYLDRVMQGVVKRVADYDHCELLP